MQRKRLIISAAALPYNFHSSPFAARPSRCLDRPRSLGRLSGGGDVALLSELTFAGDAKDDNGLDIRHDLIS